MTIAPPLPEAVGEWPERHPPLGLTDCRPVRVLQGGMGTVYLCRREQIPPYEVAVKRLLPELAARPGAAGRFLRECYHWLRLGRHPNVVAALSAHQAAPEPPILVLEYVPTTLRRLAAAGPMSVADALRAVTGIAEGLRHATAVLRGFVHRDLKPANVLVADDGTAKITDLGLSCALDTSEASLTFPRAGTPMYMAPEQMLGQPVPASDVYAIGCIAYELLVGEPVFGWSLSRSGYQRSHRQVRPVPLLRRRPDVPAELAVLIMSCLSKQASNRPGLDALAQGLRAAAARLKVSLPVPVADPADPQVLLSAAQGMLNLGFRDDAVQTCRQLLGGDPEQEAEVWARLTIARAGREDGRWEEADQQLDVVEALLPDDDRSVFRLAYLNERGAVAQAGGNLAYALECSLAAVRGWPENSASWGNLALVYEELGQRDNAVEAMSAAVERSVDLRYLEPLVGWLLQADRVEEAARHGEDAVRFHPGNGHARALRALTRLSLIAADPSKASRLFEAVTGDLRTAMQRDAPEHLILLIQQGIAALPTNGPHR